jgi:RND superfamily putative drug exporter
MFERWGRFVARRRWSVLLASLLAFAVILPLSRGATDRLTAGGWIGEGTEAFAVDTALSAEFGRTGANHYLLFRDPTGELLATDPTFIAAVEETVAPFRTDATVAYVLTYGTTGNSSVDSLLLSEDLRSSLAVINLSVTIEEATEGFEEFEDRVRSGRLDVLVGGWPAASRAFTALAEDDLTRAELITLPGTLLLLVIVFGSLAAAGLPLAIGVMAVLATLAGIGILARLTETSVFVLNVASMIGLAIAIDYSLFLISRFREELAKGNRPDDALARTMATAGKAVFVSGLTVAIGISGLAFFPTPALTSIAIGGALVVILGVGLSLSFLGALLAILGPRIDRWAIRIPRVWTGDGFWHRLSLAVMRRPLWVFVPTLVVLLAAGLPFLDYRGASPGMTMLPQDQEARRLYDRIQAGFPHTSLSPIYVLLRPDQGQMTDAANIAALQSFGDEIATRPGVRRVDGLWTYVDGFLPGASPEVVATALEARPDLRELAGRYVTADAAVLEILMGGDDSDPLNEETVSWLRSVGPTLADGAFDVQVGGGTAVTMELVDGINGRAPLAIAFVTFVTYLALLLLLRSVLLPLKAILMNLLSLGASYGALVWIFQEGHLSDLFGFHPVGYTTATVPVMMFCFVFGLSMDYEVLMLTRIREEYDRRGDNVAAVAAGLEATGRVVTSAALIMVVVFGAFASSRVLLVQSLGVGLALAVALDATLVRALLVPATMRLLGDWNWWAPAWLKRPSAR